MVNDAANKSYVDGVKQTATYFFNYEMGRDSENETKFWKSNQNTQFLMIHILQYTVRN